MSAPELALKKENIGNSKGSSLELLVKMENKQFSLELYGKRDDFFFSIIGMPYSKSNIPPNIFYSACASEILITTKAISSKLISCKNAKKLTTRMCKQGRRIKTLSHTLA